MEALLSGGLTGAPQEEVMALAATGSEGLLSAAPSTPSVSAGLPDEDDDTVDGDLATGEAPPAAE
jgi:hypothetical protein